MTIDHPCALVGVRTIAVVVSYDQQHKRMGG